MATCFSRHCVIKYAFQMLTVAASEMCDVCITKYCTWHGFHWSGTRLSCWINVHSCTDAFYL